MPEADARLLSSLAYHLQFVLKPCDLGYCAGLFDGEGSISQSKNKRYTGLTLGNKDEKVVLKFRRLVAVGNITVRKDKKGDPFFTWGVFNRKEMRAILYAFWPHLSERRRNRARELGLHK